MKTQKEKIYDLLKTRKWIRVQELQKIAWRYGARLFDLRVDGCIFKKRRQKNCNLEEWKLIKKI